MTTLTEPGRCRRFTLGDAMILVAALAVGLALARPGLLFAWEDLGRIDVPVLDSLGAWRRFLFGPNELAVSFLSYSNSMLLVFLPFLVLAALAIRLRRPRPPLRELIWQPGFAACFAPVVAVGIGLVLMFTPVPERLLGYLVVGSAPLAWAALLATRRWRSERGWIDRLGRVAGMGFTASTVASMFEQW